MKLVVYFLLSLNLIYSLEAKVLTPLEMKIFIDDRQQEVNAVAKKYKVHQNYAVIEIAKQEMLKSSVEDISYYRRVILSAFQGRGSTSGLSKTKKANPFERRIGYLALYAIGVNLDKLTDDSLVPRLEIATPEQIRHIDKVNEVIRSAFQLRSDIKKLKSNGSSTAARAIAGLVEETRVNLSKQSSQPKASKAYSEAAFMKDGELDAKYRLLPIKLSFDETANELLAGKTLFGTPAVDVLKAFELVQNDSDYKDLKAIISTGVTTGYDDYGDPKYRGGRIITESDLGSARACVLDLMCKQAKLQCIFEFYYNGVTAFKRLKTAARKRTLVLMKDIHPDKKGNAFEYDANIERVGNELNEILKECEGIGITRDSRGKLLYLQIN